MEKKRAIAKKTSHKPIEAQKTWATCLNCGAELTKTECILTERKPYSKKPGKVKCIDHGPGCPRCGFTVLEKVAQSVKPVMLSCRPVVL